MPSPYKVILVFQEQTGTTKVFGGNKTVVYKGDDVPGNFLLQDVDNEKVMRLPQDPRIPNEKWQLIDAIFVTPPTDVKSIQIHKWGEPTPILIMPGTNTPTSVIRQFQMIDVFYDPNTDLSFKQLG